MHGRPLKIERSPVDHTLTPFGKALRAAVHTTQFLPSGGQLGFALSHLYPCAAGKELEVSLLRGSDAAIMGAAAQLGLSAKVEPVWRASKSVWCMRREGFAECECPKCCEKIPFKVSPQLAVGGPLGVRAADWFCGEECEDNALSKFPRDMQGQARSVTGIHWVCSKFSWQLGLVGMGWGNEPRIDTMQSAAALIITVPPAPERSFA